MAAERECTTTRPQKFRKVSVCTEVDVDGFDAAEEAKTTEAHRNVRFGRKSQVFDAPEYDEESSSEEEEQHTLGLRESGLYSRTPEPRNTISMRDTYAQFSRLFPFTFIFVAFMVVLHNSPLIGKAGETAIGVEGGVIRTPIVDSVLVEADLAKRENSPTDVCTRFSHQSAIVNGTLYVYGGQATKSPGQKNDKWNNNFLTLDITKTWQISSPTLNGLPRPSGPPPVANGYLWNSYDSLFLYGGEYSDKPTTTPVPFALWEYQIASSTWKQHSNPRTSSGTNSDGGNQPVQEAAEGAGFGVPQLGRGWFFGGHLDPYTTAGWQQGVPRVYLKSMIEFTFPGYTNPAIDSLKNNQTAGNDGAWRNIIQGGLQTGDGFPERADGVLVYVPGYGDQGILLGLTGGTSTTFTQTNLIDVFDIASSKWHKQFTTGTSPPIRVNPCTVAASAADGSSTNVYMYGGQNLVPAGEQIQYDDIWILTVPSFTWIQVDQSGQSKPPPRAGHTCHIWDAQMVVVGGYVGQNISCDSPGIYVFDASELKWANQFTALSGGNDLNQQKAQSQNKAGLSGSYGYQVPAAVQSVIGGQATGGATVTAPAVAPTDGPLATGKPIIYTVTGPGGATVTETAYPGGGGSAVSSGPNIAAIIAGVVAGVLLLVACYLGFCAYVYRRQLQLYKDHVAMSQRAAAAGGPHEKTGFMFGNRTSAENSSSGRGNFSTDQSSGPSGNRSAMGNSGVNSTGVPGVGGPVGGNSTVNSSTEDLMTGQEPSFVGVLLNPRRSLRVINRD
jgi:hypothetical protein